MSECAFLRLSCCLCVTLFDPGFLGIVFKPPFLLRNVPIALAEGFEEAIEGKKLLWIYAADNEHVNLVTWEDPSILHESLHGTYTQLLDSACFRLLKGMLL